MLELAQHIQAFLHKHDRPPVSFYEEMMLRQQADERREMEKKERERQLSLSFIILLFEFRDFRDFIEFGICSCSARALFVRGE